MSNLFSILNSSGAALGVFQQATALVQNNVTNASTPGYVRQDPVFDALSFTSDGTLSGGVASGTPQDGRSFYAEQSVRNQVANQGFYSQLSTGLSSLNLLFDVSSKSGMSGGLSGLFTSFSNWATNPDSQSAKQNVISAASTLAAAFQAAGKQLQSLTTTTETGISSTVTQINQIAAKIQQYNKAKMGGSSPDPGLDANLYDNLEQLSGLANVVPLFQPNGTVTVLLGGQTPLVIGDQVNDVSAAYPPDAAAVNTGAKPHAAILASDGTNITSTITDGKLGGLLQARNVDIPSLMGDTQQAGSLNILAKQVADRVNAALTGAGGGALFTYSGTDATAVLSSIAVNASLTPAQMNAGTPGASNGTALALANLGQSANAGDQINGMTILNYFSSVATKVGQRISNASDQKTQADSLVAQAQTLRAQISGVSLDQEAIRVTELQRSYQASAQVITIVNAMTDSLMSILK